MQYSINTGVVCFPAYSSQTEHRDFPEQPSKLGGTVSCEVGAKRL